MLGLGGLTNLLLLHTLCPCRSSFRVSRSPPSSSSIRDMVFFPRQFVANPIGAPSCSSSDCQVVDVTTMQFITETQKTLIINRLKGANRGHTAWFFVPGDSDMLSMSKKSQKLQFVVCVCTAPLCEPSAVVFSTD